MNRNPFRVGDSELEPQADSAENLYEHAPCGYITTLPEGLITRTNQTFLAWMGYTREELLAGKRFQDLMSVGGKLFHETHFAPLLRMQGFINEVQLDLVTREGGTLPVLVCCVQKKDAAGRPFQNWISLFVISDRKKYERELLLARRKAEQAAQAKSEFLSLVSHEIRTPMNAVLGAASLLRKTELSAQQEKYVRILQSSSENLLGLINHILDFSKIDAGKVTLEARNFDLRELVYGTVFALNVKAEEKKLPVVVEMDEQVPACLVGDPVKLGQVLTNLVGNAIKFTEAGAVTVTVSVRELLAETVSLDFAVTDTGIGIAEDRLASVFEEFTQASYDIGMKYGGTGLGLAISRKLVELYGGKLCVKSTLGRGSSFYFTLRMRLGTETEDSRAAEARADTQALQGLKVLVAEDNAINVFMLSQFLRRWGADFDVVENGRQAVESVQAADYDMVLMDVRMPEQDGYEATRAIRALPGERFKHLPIIAVTASTRIGLEHRIEAAGFTDVLGKPYKPEELAARMARHRAWRRELPSAGASAGAPAPEATSPAVAPPSFSLKRVQRMLDNDPEALAELCAITLTTLEQFKLEFQAALDAGDAEAFTYQAHKLRPTVELFQAHGLRAVLERCQVAMADASAAPIAAGDALHALQRELDAFIAVLKEAMRKA